MKTWKLLGLTAHLSLAPTRAVALATLAITAMSVTSIVGCGDENDPKTWVKKLDDPAERPGAIKRLAQFFEDTSGKVGGKKDDPTVKALLDDIVEPLTKQYTSSQLDEKTRKDLIKLLSDTADPRATPAFAKAFNDYEPGKNDEDVRYAAIATTRLANQGKLTDQSLIDALWACFSKFQPSKAKSINLVTDLHDSVLAVSHPSYGPKAVEKIAAPVTDPKDPSQGLDQIQFWQQTSIQVIGNLKFAPAIKPLVTVLLTPTKSDLRSPVRTALLRIGKDSEAVLIAALKGTDPDLAKLANDYPSKAGVAVLSESIAYLSRPAGEAALLDALSNADNDQNRTIISMNLVHFPSDSKVTGAFLGAYGKIAPDADIDLMGGANGHSVLTQACSLFYDPKMTDWVLKELANAKGDAADQMPPAALDAAIKLMTPDQEKEVGDAVNKLKGPALEKDKFKAASAVLEQCKADASCYVTFLDQPIPSSPDTAKFGAIKATFMAAIFGNNKTANDLIGKIDKVKDGAVRLSLAEAIDHLLPKGDANAAAAMQKIVDADKASGNKTLIAADDAVVKVSLKLVSRQAP